MTSINPQAYLSDVLGRIADHPIHKIMTFCSRLDTIVQFSGIATNHQCRGRRVDATTGWTSLGTKEWDDAIFVSVDKLAEREQMAKAGIQPATRKTKELHTVAEIAVTTLGSVGEGTPSDPGERTGTKRRRQGCQQDQSHQGTDRPGSLANGGIAHLTEEDMERFAGSHTVDGEAPKTSTIGNLNSAWLELLSDAVSLGHIKDAHKRRLTISTRGFEKGLRGDAFSREEMMALRAYMSDAWVAAGAYEKVRESRFLLRALVSLHGEAQGSHLGWRLKRLRRPRWPKQLTVMDGQGCGWQSGMRRESASHRGSFGRGSMMCGLSSATCVRC